MSLMPAESQLPVIVLIGKNGQVGWECQRALMPVGRVIAFDRQQMNLADSAQIRHVIAEIKPDVIINAAAYTAVDQAEDAADLAMQINAIAPAVIAEEAARCNALLIHYSTDYVFNGSKQQPWTEHDQPAPLNYYGQSKLDGELAIAASAADYLIFRTSWVYAARGQNFLLTMLRLLREHERLTVVDDQIGSPTWARLIAEVTACAVWQSLQQRRASCFTSALLHLASAGETSWFGFASAIRALETTRSVNAERLAILEPIASVDYPLKAVRPLNSRLDCQLLEHRFGLSLPRWQTGLELCLDQSLRSV